MTSLQLNAELFRELSIISEDEGMMKKAIKALKRITAQKQTMDETDSFHVLKHMNTLQK